MKKLLFCLFVYSASAHAALDVLTDTLRLTTPSTVKTCTGSLNSPIGFEYSTNAMVTVMHHADCQANSADEILHAPNELSPILWYVLLFENNGNTTQTTYRCNASIFTDHVGQHLTLTCSEIIE